MSILYYAAIELQRLNGYKTYSPPPPHHPTPPDGTEERAAVNLVTLSP